MSDIPLRALALIPRFDPDAERRRILDQFDAAELDQVDLFGARILVAKWIRDKDGSIHLTQRSKMEDDFQGKVGLVLKVGPLAFEDDANHDWRGQRVEPGQWVMYRNSDGNDFAYRPVGTHSQIPCKVLEEGHIQMILPRPDFAY